MSVVWESWLLSECVPARVFRWLSRKNFPGARRLAFWQAMREVRRWQARCRAEMLGAAKVTGKPVVGTVHDDGRFTVEVCE